jgi:hypothetical protein
VTFSFTGVTGNFSVDYIIQNVIDDTGRPDKVEEIKRRIQRAVMFHHLKDFYKKDHNDNIYVFLTSDTEQVIDTNLIDRFRQFSYVRKYMTVDQNGNPIQPTTQDGEITAIAPELAFDGYGFDKTDVMYRSGTDIKIRSANPITQVFIGYFSFPVIEPIENLDSWIANTYPALIVARAKRRIFKDLGKDDEAKSAREEEEEELQTLQTNEITLKVM